MIFSKICQVTFIQPQQEVAIFTLASTQEVADEDVCQLRSDRSRPPVVMLSNYLL